MLSIGLYEEVLLATKLVIVNVGPVKHHELIISRQNEMLRYFVQSIIVFDWVNSFTKCCHSWCVNFLRKVHLCILREGPGEATIGLPHPVQFCIEVRYNWDERCDTQDLYATGASGGSDVPSCPTSL